MSAESALIVDTQDKEPIRESVFLSDCNGEKKGKHKKH